MNQIGVGESATQAGLVTIGNTLLIGAGAKKVIDTRANRQLRAYYGHTSKY